MQFEYQERESIFLILLDTQDFSEDTYRTLMAVDAAVMVIDSAKGKLSLKPKSYLRL